MSGALTVAAVIAIAAFGMLPGVFYGVVAVLSLLPGRKRPHTTARHQARIAVLVPAHNEADGLPTLLTSLAALNYPRELLAVHVVADNCSDETALVARAHGAHAYERADPRRSGKGAALNWLIRQVLAVDLDVEMLVFLDADSRVGPEFLDAIMAEFERGATIVQALNLIETTSDRPLGTLRKLAFHLVCDLRPRAYERLGVSVGLHGNGMAFARSVVSAIEWDEDAVVEDGAMHLRLVDQGLTVAFAPAAGVRSVVPETLRPAYGQTVRWERGKFDLFGPGALLVWRGLKLRDLSRFVAGCDAIVPPYVVTVTACLAGILGGFLLATPTTVLIGGVGFGGCALYLARGVALARLGAGEVMAVARFAPAFAMWKLGVIGRVATGAGRGQWVRSTRRPNA